MCRKVAHGIGVIIKARKAFHSESAKCLVSSFIYPYMMYCNQVWDLRKNKHGTHFAEAGCKDYSRCLHQVIFRAIFYYIDIFELWKYLQISHMPSLMYRVYYGELCVLHCLFTTISNLQTIRQNCHYHMPLYRTYRAKCGLKYVGASVWNNILSIDMNPNIGEISFSRSLNTLRPKQTGRHFADDIFKWIFLNENVWMPIKISLKFVPEGPINNIPALVQIMAWRLPGDKPLSGAMMARLPTHICVTRPQWVKATICNSSVLKFWINC